jgi:hypothetical protein
MTWILDLRVEAESKNLAQPNGFGMTRKLSLTPLLLSLLWLKHEKQIGRKQDEVYSTLQHGGAPARSMRHSWVGR